MNKSVRQYLVEIGKKGGRVTSKAKAEAVRKNGLLGGRPRKFRELSAYQAAQNVSKGEPWKIAFMNFVDGFRRHPSRSLVEKAPSKVLLDPKMYALLQSICIQLCSEEGLSLRGWLARSAFLPEPWFVSGMKNLYAMALRESPISFRKNNIFVLENFLSRA